MTNLLSLDLLLKFGSFQLSARSNIPLSGIIGLSGPSGCGKTSLLKIIAGLQKADEGSVYLNDVPWQNRSRFVPAYQRNIGFVFQDARLFSHLNVIENIRFGLRFRPTKTLNPDLIDALELGELLKRQVAELSGGEQRRVALARALAISPKLMLLDEPMSGLDTARRERLFPFFTSALKTMGCPAIYVSHDQIELMKITDAQYCISNGVLEKIHKPLPKYGFNIVSPNTGEFGGVVFDVPNFEFGDTPTFRIAPDKMLLSRNKPDIVNATFTIEVEVCEDTASGGRFLSGVGAHKFYMNDLTQHPLGHRLWLTALGVEFCY